MKQVLIMAGGTGGHVFPGLVVAQTLREQGVGVHWLGTRRGLESDLVPKADIPISYVSISGWRGNGLKKWVTAPFVMIRALSQAIHIIRRVNPDVVLGMGGFASGPGGLAAWLLRKPLVIHEQNAIPGLTNRVLSFLARGVLQAFPNTFSKIHRKVITLGNPLRPAIVELATTRQPKGKKIPLHLLIVGGSQGALMINKILPNALSMMGAEIRPVIWHQTGKFHLEETRRMYQVLGIKAKLDAFIDNMAEAYQWADLVVCRAGALTISELIAAGLGSILVPYPHATDNHQLRNAQYLAHAGAAIILPQTEFSSIRLAELLRKLMREQEKISDMSQAAGKLYQPNATQQVIENCLKFVKDKVENSELKVVEIKKED